LNDDHENVKKREKHSKKKADDAEDYVKGLEKENEDLVLKIISQFLLYLFCSI
jgi:hypothetical protein